MNVYELVERLNGEIVSNQARVRVDGKFVVVGTVGANGLEINELGMKIAESLTGAPVAPVVEAEDKPKAKTGRPKKVVAPEPVEDNLDYYD